MLDSLLDSQLQQFLLELSDQLFLLWPEYLFEFLEAHLFILPNASTPFDMSPVMVPQVVATRKALATTGYLTQVGAVLSMHSLHVTTKMLWSNEALVATSTCGAGLRLERTDVDALRGLRKRISERPLAELQD